MFPAPLVTHSIATRIALRNVGQDCCQVCSNVIHSKACKAVLLRKVVTKTGSSKFYPFKAYPYNSLILTLERFFSRPGFYDLVERTRNDYVK